MDEEEYCEALSKKKNQAWKVHLPTEIGEKLVGEGYNKEEGIILCTSETCYLNKKRTKVYEGEGVQTAFICNLEKDIEVMDFLNIEETKSLIKQL